MKVPIFALVVLSISMMALAIDQKCYCTRYGRTADYHTEVGCVEAGGCFAPPHCVFDEGRCKPKRYVCKLPSLRLQLTRCVVMTL